MAQKMMLVCDVCGKPAEQTATLTVGALRYQKDYCAEHLAQLTDGARASRGPGRPRGSRTKPANGRRRPRRQAQGRRRTNNGVLAEMKRLRDQGLTYRQIGDALIERGFTPPRAERWNTVVIGRLLKRD